jgi:trehalose 2-sulfotransferase
LPFCQFCLELFKCLAGDAALIADRNNAAIWQLAPERLPVSSRGVCGIPREYFHVNFVAATSQELGLTPAGITKQYLSELLRRAEMDGVMFSVKNHWLQINQLLDAFRLIHPAIAREPAPKLIEASLPGARYLYLTRQDKARQAVSMFRAMRSEQWWDAGDAARPDSVGTEYAPDHLAIRWFESDLSVEDAEWRRYFEVFGIQPLTLIYEDLVARPYETLQQVLDWLGFTDVDLPEPQSQLQRQADNETERTLHEYITLRDSLPLRPDGWVWSHERRAFGLPERRVAPPDGQTNPVSKERLSPL